MLPEQIPLELPQELPVEEFPVELRQEFPMILLDEFLLQLPEDFWMGPLWEFALSVRTNAIAGKISWEFLVEFPGGTPAGIIFGTPSSRKNISGTPVGILSGISIGIFGGSSGGIFSEILKS